MLLPVNFPYWAFALLIALNGIGSGMFGAPNSSSIMGSVPAQPARRGLRHALDLPELGHGAVDRGVLLADDRRAGRRLPHTLTTGLRQHGVAAAVAHRSPRCRRCRRCSPRCSASTRSGTCCAHRRRAGARRPRSTPLTGREFFPRPDLRPVPPRPDHGVRGRRRPRRCWPPWPRCCAAGGSSPPSPVHGAPADRIDHRPKQGPTVPLTTLEPTAALIVVDLQAGHPTESLANWSIAVIATSAQLARAFRDQAGRSCWSTSTAPRPGVPTPARSARELPARGRLEIVPSSSRPTMTSASPSRPGDRSPAPVWTRACASAAWSRSCCAAWPPAPESSPLPARRTNWATTSCWPSTRSPIASPTLTATVSRRSSPPGRDGHHG